MPKKTHKHLLEEAEKQGLKGKAKAAYVYGTLAKIEKKKNAKRK